AEKAACRGMCRGSRARRDLVRHRQASPQCLRASATVQTKVQTKVQTNPCRPACPCQRSRPWRSWAPDSFHVQDTTCGLQGRNHVAANINEALDAGLAPMGFVFPGTSGEMDDGAGGCERPGRGGCLALINFVGRA